jgi:hypothetical protein
MPTELQPSSLANALLWTGRIITGLVVLFLIFDGITKVSKITPVMEACERLGLPPHTVVGIGALLLFCTAIYAIPQSAVLGAILLTGYLGGATAIHVRGGSGWFEICFSVAFGVLTWVGLVLREPRLFGTILMRQ